MIPAPFKRRRRHDPPCCSCVSITRVVPKWLPATSESSAMAALPCVLPARPADDLNPWPLPWPKKVLIFEATCRC